MFTTVQYPFFIKKTVCKHLGTEETFGRTMLSHSCRTLDSRCWTVLGSLCYILRSMKRQMFSADERSRVRTVSSTMKPCCSCGMSCWNMQDLPRKRCCLNGAHVALKPVYALVIDVNALAPFSIDGVCSDVRGRGIDNIKKNFKFQSVWPYCSLPLCLGPFLMSFKCKDCSVSWSCSHMASSLHYRTLASCGLNIERFALFF